MNSIHERWEAEFRKATKLKAIYLDVVETIEGVLWGTVYLQSDYSEALDQYCKLPQLISLQGKMLLKTGWNSDRCVAHYKQISSAQVADILKQ